MRVLHERPLLW